MGRIYHPFVNPIPDEPSFPGTKPSDWNADHVIDLTMADIVFIDSDYPTRSFKQVIKIRNEGTAEEYIETLWEEVL